MNVWFMLLPTFWPLLADNDCGFFTVIMLRILWNPERNERRLVWRFCVKAHHHYHSIIIIAKAAHFRTWIMRNPEAAWVVLMDFSVLRQVPLMIITFFSRVMKFKKKSWWFQRRVPTYGTMSSKPWKWKHLFRPIF